MAAEQKARATYEKLIDLCKDDKDVVDVLKYLRQREIVHFQRFGDALRVTRDNLEQFRNTVYNKTVEIIEEKKHPEQTTLDEYLEDKK